MLDLLIRSGLNPDSPDQAGDKSFLVLSIYQCRTDLFEVLLGAGVSALNYIVDSNGTQTCAYTLAVKLGNLDCLKLIRSKYKVPINEYCNPQKPALISLVESDYLSETEMIPIAEQLLEWGAHPYRKRRGEKDVMKIASERKLFMLSDFLKRNYASYGPAYSREARKNNIKDLCLHYEKACGLIFRIADFDFPFFAGGDHDGAYLISAKDAWAQASGESVDLNFKRVGWFLPFLDRIASGQEISFDDLMNNRDRFVIYTEDQSANWD